MSATVQGPATGVRKGAPLRLLRQATVVDLLGRHAHGLTRFEASGVTHAEGRLLVIFDNLPHVASLDADLTPDRGRLVVQPGPAAGYEDVAYDTGTGRVFAVVEAARTPGGWRPQIDELDGAAGTGVRVDGGRWRRVERLPVDVRVSRRNKGLEGLACVHREGATYLLALSEDSGKVHVLARGAGRWDAVDTFRLPPDLDVDDYAGLSVRGDRIAVVSQESSTLWVGRLAPDAWRVTDAGRRHRFPKDERGGVVYGTVEGVCWLDDTTVATVCDIPKHDDPPAWRTTAASVHVFAIPGDGDTMEG